MIDTTLPTITLCGIPIHAVTEQQANQHIMDCLAREQGGWVVTPNLDHMRRLVVHEDFLDLCRGADLVVADGMPLVLASRLKGAPLPERVAGSSMILTLTAAAAQHERSVFLLGGDPGTAEKAAEKLSELYPGLRVAGVLCPPMGFESDQQYMQQMYDALRESQPDVVYVALGSPKQEKLIFRLREELPDLSGTWWLGVGISFSFVTGDVKRAPRWMQKTGLEWVHRLVQEPRRLFRRYIIEDLPFAFRLFGSALRDRFSRKSTTAQPNRSSN